MTSLYEQCCKIYAQKGQYGVFAFILSKHPEVDWKVCQPCEIESPVQGRTCLVCGDEGVKK